MIARVDANEYNFCVEFQTENQKALWQQILDIVNKTNLIDYTMDIRKRLQLGDTMPEVCFSVCGYWCIL